MMDSEIISLVYKLKEEIVNSDLYKDLKKKEKEMLEDEECSKLLIIYQNKQSEYNEAKRFEKYGSNIGAVSNELSCIKYKVDENEFVKRYSEAFKMLNKKLKDIESILFKDIVKSKKEIMIG